MAKVSRHFARVVIASGGTTSDEFNEPENMESMTIHTPALTGTLTLQAKAPVLNENDTAVWSPVTVFDLNAGTTNVVLDAIPASSAITIPGSATGGGPFRLVSSGAEAAERDIRITFKEF